MFQDLLDTQDAPLERFLFTSIIPSLLITSFLNVETFWGSYPSRDRGHQIADHWAILPVCTGLPLPEGVFPLPNLRPGPSVTVGPARVMSIKHRWFSSSHWDQQVMRALPVFATRVQAYPPAAIEARVEGTVMVEAILDRDGHARISNMGVSPRAPFLLRAAAQEAVLGTQFYQARLNGVSQEALVEIAVQFSIPK